MFPQRLEEEYEYNEKKKHLALQVGGYAMASSHLIQKSCNAKKIQIYKNHTTIGKVKK